MRVHVMIPNVEHYDTYIEIGKMFDSKWIGFKDSWFYEYDSHILIHYTDLEDFYNDLRETDEHNVEESEHRLYNLDKLKELIDFAIEHKYFIHVNQF